MGQELRQMIDEGRKALRRAAGGLSPEEQIEDEHQKAVDELEGFMLRRLSVRLPIILNAEVAWTDKGPAINFAAEGQVFIMRKHAKKCSVLIKDGEGGEREIAGIEADDPEFASRFLVAIGDAVSRGQ